MNHTERWDKKQDETAHGVHIEVYCDEIMRSRDQADGSLWTYIGALFVPVKTKATLLKELLDRRCIGHDHWHRHENECP